MLQQPLFEFQWRELSEARVRAYFVESTPEFFDHYFRIESGWKPLHAQALVAKLAVE